MKCKINYVAEVELEEDCESVELSKEFVKKCKENISSIQETFKIDLDNALPCKDEQSTITIEFIDEEETINE